MRVVLAPLQTRAVPEIDTVGEEFTVMVFVALTAEQAPAGSSVVKVNATVPLEMLGV